MMSVEKEAGLCGDGGGDGLAALQPPRCRLGGRTLATPPAVLAEVPGKPAPGQVGCGVGARPLQSKNGLPQAQRSHKRRYSMNVGFRQPGAGKRRCRASSESEPVLPSNFLLGGNIFDPLNLNSLLDEEVSRALNAETPKSSPLPAKSREPVEILVPKDITDPLNLNGCGRDSRRGALLSPTKTGRKRHRNRHHGERAGPADQAESDKKKGEEGGLPGDAPQSEDSPQPYELNTSINCRDEVVLPILPRRHSHPPTGSSGATSRHRKRRRTVSRSERLSTTPTLTKGPGLTKPRPQTFQTPIAGLRPGPAAPAQASRKPARKFQYGNYSRYYGYHRPTLRQDPRLAVLKPDWFRGKNVLDLGCNTGHVTLAIARNWGPAHILGLDIDGGLVRVARQNLRHFLSELLLQEEDGKTGTAEPAGGGAKTQTGTGEEDVGAPVAMDTDVGQEFGAGIFRALMDVKMLTAPPDGRAAGGQQFPLSLRLCRGPIVPPPLLETSPGVFPANVSFMRGNYVLDSDVAVDAQRAEYDAILCLSLTKWVHLNWGDAGLQRLFRRAYRHLRVGGVFILEPQPWSSYAKRKRLTETTYRNYGSIHLKPDRFSSYLTTEVGFTSYELVGTPKSGPQGFQRPIYIFHKGPSSSRK
ncbi:7SK snRNA methylphosphate capping enzyme isoform X2 [Denticeps clupeoides]|uniref:RNA methyltransferase n=1 Tax=Denticeps clupeoides TaxID=299321 RepID=A0AAY4AJ87_9TELE|nr:7SK snRNA methylphosphate capping enzyme-like isoform X2 [Denticeps clupeoides]